VLLLIVADISYIRHFYYSLYHLLCIRSYATLQKAMGPIYAPSCRYDRLTM